MAAPFSINTYAYTMTHTARETIAHLTDEGYDAFELMMYPGHLWPTELSEPEARAIRRLAEERGARLVSLNMPNIDINVGAASEEMRTYSLDLLSAFVRVAGRLSIPYVIVGPGKANPLFPAPREEMDGRFFAALDRLAPIAAAEGVTLLVENMPFAYLPGAGELMEAVDRYGNPDIGVIYDVANGHFIGEDPSEGLRRVASRLKLIHLSDTGQRVYRHDPVGEGDVPFESLHGALAEVAPPDKLMLEIISKTPDEAIADSVRRLKERMAVS